MILTPPSAFSPKNRTENNNRSQPFFVMNFYDFGLGSCWCSKVLFPQGKNVRIPAPLCETPSHDPEPVKGIWPGACFSLMILFYVKVMQIALSYAGNRLRSGMGSSKGGWCVYPSIAVFWWHQFSSVFLLETEPKGLRKEDGLGTLGLFLLIVIFSCSICSTSLFGFGLPGNDVREKLAYRRGLGHLCTQVSGYQSWITHVVQSDLRILGMDKSWYVIEGRSVLVIEFNKLQVFGFFSWVRMRWVR